MEITIKLPEAHVELMEELNVSKETITKFIRTQLDMTILDDFEIDEFRYALENYLVGRGYE